MRPGSRWTTSSRSSCGRALDDLQREFDREILSADGQDAGHVKAPLGELRANGLGVDRVGGEAEVGLDLRPEKVRHRAVPQEVP